MSKLPLIGRVHLMLQRLQSRQTQMEYTVQAWSPHLVKDILIVENVQGRATKLVNSISDKSYETRKLALEMTS